MIIDRFTNEIGNHILIKIKHTNDEGINHKTKEKISFEGVKILIRGPTSDTENILTRMEAYELYRSLKTFFNKE